MHPRSKFLILLVSSALVHAVMAQSGSEDARTTPVFRSDARLVEVSIVATGKNAKSIALQKEDFDLFDDGLRQDIAVFSSRSRTSTPDADAKPPRFPPDAVSNRPHRDSQSSTNDTVLFIDQKNTPQVVQAFAIERMKRFVHERHENERIGIYTLSRSGAVEVIQELTNNQAVLDRAVDQLKARDPSFRTNDDTGFTVHAAQGLTAIELLERGTETRDALKAIARHLAKGPGHKRLIWLTTSFPLFNLELGIDFRPDMEVAGRALNDANIALYAIDARGLQGALQGLTPIQNAESEGPRSPGQLAAQMRRGEREPLELATMNMLADSTGGLVYYNNSNAIEESIQRAVSDGETSYLLGFYPSRGSNSGTWHKMKIRVNQPGINLRYRESYFASRQAPLEERPTLTDLLRDHLDATQLELTAYTTRDSANDDLLNVVVNIDPGGLKFQTERENRVAALDISIHVDGTPTVSTRNVNIRIPDRQFSAYLQNGIEVVQQTSIADGAEVLRVVVQDRNTGAAGSVTVPVPGLTRPR
jgi:VWFA-related protein